MRKLKTYIRTLLLSVILLMPLRLWAVGWTPTDGGLVVNLEQGDRFLLSVMVDHDNNPSTPDREYFVVNYSRYEGDDYFHYKNAQGKFIYADGKHLKLAQQDAHATEPSEMSIWSVGAPLARGKYDLGGIVYTIWNDGKTLRTNNTNYQFMGDLTSDYNYKDACDAVFVVPTDHNGIESFDPNSTLTTVYGRDDQASGGKINGKMGQGFLGMTYREVYLLDFPKSLPPMTYTNASLVTFNTTSTTKSWSNGQITCYSGFPAYAFKDDKHNPTHRTLFRLYLLDDPINSCSSYFFATDEQDVVSYRNVQDPKTPKVPSEWTTPKKVYTWDHFVCMDSVPGTKLYKTDYLNVPVPDSTYYYVGYNNDYRNGSTGSPSEPLGSSTAKSAFKKIRELPLLDLPTLKAPAGAYGRMVVDTSETADNLGVKFEPAGYMLKVSTGTNVRMKQTAANQWTSEQMWTIDTTWAKLKIKATLMTDSIFREDDPGMDIVGWSIDTLGTKVPVVGGGSVVDQSGYARITTTSDDPNGHLEFVLANKKRHIHYDNNELLGVQIPDQFPLAGETTLMIEKNRLKADYIFDGWSKTPNGPVVYAENQVIKLDTVTGWVISEKGDSTLTLYAQAHYNGTLQVALSFIGEDGKRYFMTHPGTGTFRYARARHFDDWENTWQGMENAENLDPNYLSTYEMRYPENEVKAYQAEIAEGDRHLDIHEKVLDPRRYTMRGYEDSLTFYEYFAPAKDEYIGLYYTSPNTIVANNTWAGLFTTTSTATSTGWPDYRKSSLDSVKLKSERYVEEEDPEHHPDSLTLKLRTNNDKPFVKYNATTDEFNGVATEGEATYFQISAVAVADAHYIIVPDTTETWRDTVVFDMHQDEQIREELWTSLIGKQLMAVMKVGKDTVFFHPNRNKVINNPNDLYLSQDFRVSQFYDFIRDSRVTTVDEADRVTFETTDYHWHNTIVSGMNSPINVRDGAGNYIDIFDTIRINLSHGGISKIKEYRGRWNAKDPKVTASKDGSSRFRNVIIKTKTYHYGEDEVKYILTPAQENYTFNPFKDQAQRINFTLTKLTTHQLLDVDNKSVRTDTVDTEDVTSKLAIDYTDCEFAGSYFSVINAETANAYVTVQTADTNKTVGDNLDTLIIRNLTVTIDDNTYPVEVASVPLKQTSLVADELVWSVLHNGQRYFIMAGSGGLIFRQYTQRSNSLYKLNTNITLIKGSADAENSDARYITPWSFSYVEGHPEQLMLDTKYGVGKKLTVSGDNVIVGDAASEFSYQYVNVFTNDNANEEEWVKLKYLDNKWVKFNGAGLELTTEVSQADTFSWGYLQQEYNLLNNGTYPSHQRVEFGYNTSPTVKINTRYKAYREYSMLLGNKLTYLGREESTSLSDLTSEGGIWKTTCSIDTICDSRVATKSSRLNFSTSNMVSTVKPQGSSPREVKDAGGKYIDIVDTLCVTLGLQGGAPAYRYKDAWSGYGSISDGNLKIPLIRKTYHEATFDSLYCSVSIDEVNVSFPATITVGTNDTILYKLSTILKEGTRLQDVDGNLITETSTSYSYVNKITEDERNIGMHLNNKALAEVRLMDEYGNTPDWCKIKSKGDSTLVVQCLKDGVRSPRSAFLYFAYIITLDGNMRFVNYRITVSQDSRFDHAALQTLEHSKGASGDEKMENGMQQVHENKRILYYYPDQDTELPVRERAFYGWWRWYREGEDEYGTDVSDADIPDSLWRLAPQNKGAYNYPFRTIIVDSVLIDPGNPEKGKKLGRTMGRYTVFHYKSRDYNKKADPPAKNPRVAPPDTIHTGVNRGKHATLTYAVDLSNYYDKLPLSLSHKNQVDTALLDTILQITEPTLSLREIFELHPWTEMAEKLERYKDTVVKPCSNLNYMEDHVVMAPLHTRLLLQTEQRYNLENVTGKGHSESLLGYYMRDDNWAFMPDTLDKDGWSRRDSMIWCGGWDADCLWFTYNPKAVPAERYQPCNYPITEGDDFLKVPEKNNIDTVFYCLRARSKATAGEGTKEKPDVTNDEGAYWFNICRYKIIYHDPNTYGPKQETVVQKEARALITNDEIEQRYEVLERLNFDYLQPGSNYHIYPHPLPWADASYGYSYPETPDLPHNRYHNETDFPNHGEYGLINRIPYSSYWHKMEQHGGAENGYMIYCDGMSSSGQVAALSLQTNLCAGQKMFFSAYVGNPSNQKDKANPNFIFTVQGRVDERSEWEDITSYMTGDIQPSDKWYQIYFPINHNKGSSTDKDVFTHFRVRIYNVSSDWDGNDFIIDDMCIFATKPPLIAYQANTACKEEGETKDTHVILRVDYQGITGEGYNGKKVYYTVQQMTEDSVFSFVPMSDKYLEDSVVPHVDPDKYDTICGKLYIPLRTYEPQDEDSIFANVNALLDRFEDTYKIHKEHEADPDNPEKPDTAIFREGYIYEILEGEPRPVKYTVHSAQMDPKNTYTVHMSGTYDELLSSICGMTSYLKVSNRMVLELNGLEKPVTELVGLCANSTYDVSLRVKGSLYLDSVAPIDLNGSCTNDWLLYGDTLEDSSIRRYGYYYSDIKKVITEALRIEPSSGTNKNQFAPNLSSIDKNELIYFFNQIRKETLKQPGLNPYTMISDLVNNGFLTLYKSQITVTVNNNDSVQFIILPIVGTGTDALNNANIEVCPAPIFVKLGAEDSGGIPLMVGGLHRDTTELSKPVEVLALERIANDGFLLRVDSIMSNVGIQSITLRSTNDPEFREGIHSLSLDPDIIHRTVDAKDYYHKGDSILLTPSSSSNYEMRQGYSYTFNIVMQDNNGRDTLEGGCAVGTIPFTLSVMPDYLRWNPQSKQSNQWNNADNWIGVTKQNVPIHEDAHFAPMSESYVVIPQMAGGMPYPVVPPLPTEWKDSVQKVNFEYNNCKAIRFLSGAAIGQQQRMRYSDAIIDMDMPQQKWAFRSAPVTGMLSGDIYMADADLYYASNPWSVAEFDAAGRTYKYGNASFWLSVYSRQTIHEVKDSTEHRTAESDWSKVTNGLSLYLPPASGWAIYSRTKSGKAAEVRLPKNDSIYYYYGSYGETLYDRYVNNLREERDDNAGGEGKAGKLAFYPDGVSQTYTLSNEVADTAFVFGNPTMGYIDIWGFISDNCLRERFDYMDESGAASIYRSISKTAAEATQDTLTNIQRYLPPMRAIVVKKANADEVTGISVILGTNRVVTDPSQTIRPLISPCKGGGDQGKAQAPGKSNITHQTSNIKKGIMTVTAINPCSPRCTSYLLLGQGYHDEILDGEDAILTTVNINAYTNNTNPSTPFNLYAVEGESGLCIDLRDEIVSVPLSFYMSDLEYDAVTHLWFSGVNNIDGLLVLYDALTGTERVIIDGICLDIETPQVNHEKRYYIRRLVMTPEEEDPEPGTATSVESFEDVHHEKAIKLIYNGHVYIIRNGHVYTMMGQRIR